MIAPVVDVAWLRAHRDGVVFADVRWYLDGRSGRAAYEHGHLPGAVFVDLDAWLAGDGSPARGRHPLPDPERFARGMEAAGIGDADTVVAYDDDGGVIAARLVWMLRATGHEAALLDGGLHAWDGPLARAAAAPVPAGAGRFTPVPWPPERLATIDEAADPGTLVLDARPRERFRGDVEPVDPRAGHIPGAVSVPARENVGADRRLLAPEVLRARFTAAGVDAGADVISSCGSGVTACHAAGPRARRPGPRPAVRGVVVAVERRPVAGGRDGRLAMRKRAPVGRRGATVWLRVPGRVVRPRGRAGAAVLGPPARCTVQCARATPGDRSCARAAVRTGERRQVSGGARRPGDAGRRRR